MAKGLEKKFDELSRLVETAFTGVAADIADIKDHLLSKDDVREIVREELKPIEDRLTGVESKVDGINRRLDSEAMERTDHKLPARVAKLEQEVFGESRSPHV